MKNVILPQLSLELRGQFQDVSGSWVSSCRILEAHAPEEQRK